MRALVVAPLAVLAIFLTIIPAQAHIVGLGWTFGPGGDVTFDAMHWHGNRSAAWDNGALIVDGTSYAFTSVTNNTLSMTGLDGALTNPTYSSYDGAGTLTAINNGGGLQDNWLHVTISGLAAGMHTITADWGPGGLTAWTLDNSIQTFQLNTPPPTGGPAPVPEPGTIVLLGLGIIGLGLYGRNRKQKRT